MNEINSAVYSGKNDKGEPTNKVTITAGFDTLEEAVRFHLGLATLCQRAAGPRTWRLFSWTKK